MGPYHFRARNQCFQALPAPFAGLRSARMVGSASSAWGGDGAELMRSNEALPVPESVMQGSNLGMQSTHLLRVDFAGLLGYAAREALLSQRPRSSDRGRRRAERVQGNPTLGLLHQSGENKYRTISQSLQENVRSLSLAREIACGSSSARSVRQGLGPFGGVRRRRRERKGPY
jgi:hypothetical protein